MRKRSIWASPWMISVYILVPTLFLWMGLMSAISSEPVADSSPDATRSLPIPVVESPTNPADESTEKPDRTRPPRVPASAKGPYGVIRVVDGDTVHVAYKGRDTTIRLIGIDTPETVAPGQPVECFGKRASQHMRRLLDGRPVYVATDPSQDRRDRYGRLLAYLWLPTGKFVNLHMLRAGFAREYTYDVAYRYQTKFKAAARKAATRDRGLWSHATCDGRTERPHTEPVTRKPKTSKPPAGGGLDPRYDTCAEANSHGYGPYVKGVNLEYDWYIDADSDGIVCERS